MGAENNGEAAPVANGHDQPAQNNGEFTHDMMAGVFGRFGVKLTKPEEKKPETKKTDAAAANGGGEGEGEAAAGGEAHAAAAAGEKHAEGANGAEAAEAAGGEEGGKGEGEGEGEGAAAGEGGGEGEGEARGEESDVAKETNKIVASKLKDLPPELRDRVQGVINGRIAEIVKKSNSENDRLAARVVEVTTELENVRKNGAIPVQVPGIHPTMLAETPAQIDQHEAALESFIAWAEDHQDTGYEGDASKNEQSYTADQIRTRLREVRREMTKVIPQARANLQARAQMDANLKKAFPAMYNPATEEYAAAQNILKTFPELRKFADSPVLIAQQILGRKALNEVLVKAGFGVSQAGGQQQQQQNKSTKAPVTPAKKAPRAPGSGSPSRGSVLDQPGNQRSDATAEISTFTKSKSKTDLKKAVRALVFTG